MVEELVIARSELILGGQKSGKSRRAELLARRWLAQSPAHGAVLIATAQPWDEEMRERIDKCTGVAPERNHAQANLIADQHDRAGSVVNCS